jgi:hypothetical protein
VRTGWTFDGIHVLLQVKSKNQSQSPTARPVKTLDDLILVGLPGNFNDYFERKGKLAAPTVCRPLPAWRPSTAASPR